MWLVNHQIKYYNIGLTALKTMDRTSFNMLEIFSKTSIHILRFNELIDLGNLRLIGSNNKYQSFLCLFFSFRIKGI